MSAGLIGGVVGAAVGFFVGGPAGASWGWMIGSAAGSILSQPSAGPNLTDLTPQSSEYGRPIPIIYSVMAVGGNVIWASDLVKTGDAGGKGSSDASSSQGTYAANFAVLICESAGDKTLGRIWSGPDKRLVYDPATGKLESGTLTFYNGAEDQMPDPLMESYLGAGNVPAYRGYAVVVIQNFNVTNHDGNRIPILTIEIGAQGTPVSNSGPENLGTAWIDRMWTASGATFVLHYYGTNGGYIQVRQSDMSMVHNRSLTPTHAYDFWDDARNTVSAMPLLATATNTDFCYETLSMTSGAVTARSPFVIADGDIGTGAGFGNSQYVFVFNRNAGGYAFVFVDPATNAFVKTLLVDVGDTDQIANFGSNSGVTFANPSDSFCWIAKISGKVCAVDLTATGTTSSTLVGTLPTVAGIAVNHNDYHFAFDLNDNMLWAARLSGGTSGGTLYYAAFTPTGQISSGSMAVVFSALSFQPWLFTPAPIEEGSIPFPGVWLCGWRYIGMDHFVRFDPATGVPVPWRTGEPLEIDGVNAVDVTTNTLLAAQYSPSGNLVVGVRFNALWGATASGDLYPLHIEFDDGILHGADAGGGGLGAANYQTLGDVVTDLSLRAGLTADQIDVTQLTDQVDGYTIASQVAVMDAIRTVMPVYYFDAVESGGLLKFVKRGGDLAVEIDDDDLGAQPSDQTGVVDLLQTTRGNDDDLPGTLSANYVLAATNYGPATKYARRLIGYSQSEQTLDLPLVLSDQKAQEVAQVNLHDAWVGRLTYAFQLPRKFSDLEPTDVVGIQGYTMRITKMTQSADGYFKCEAVRDDATTYTPHVNVTETPPNPQTVSAPSLTLLELM